ncbi:BREX-1 system adenine-specific DNA-methyltransferase PglX [Dasania sp. GY-19]|uniref:site-specific DNA-methyltransferase (adenine-specific) n=1 Tax=Dasania phycosphaerae TaxID=2950436 RepID=A0A9J6RQ24_9GAMM|nr:BREX-1 system adenine-specific DNA-methyltransferase PglX [Dasania phycosphaerae]MCZ0866450.1 BREX-1 system adenine-specific DNA-methyltransferase PglX [Dasania phycosphaerae]
MNTNNVKKYAPKARKAFIEAMSKQAAKYGITKKKIEPAEQKGDLVLIGDRPFPASVIKPRERLVKRIEQQGFDQVMEHVAYSWFNRLCAIRYMERKGFLDHGRRVLSAADGSAGVPQILEECLDVELPGLDQAKVRDLKLDGTKDEELYRELLLAQCHALHQAMPFLFEAVADESELLLPENLTKTDSLIRDLVASVPDEDWEHIEIIGWLYQFYISEKKDQVIGKVVKSEDIPAATQLFTPNWIVQYMVQNTVGRQWLQTYPDSPLKGKMPYYIKPAEQTPEVQDKLAETIPSEITPELTKVLDCGCGSGHILIEAYKVLKAIYEERGYRTRDIPQLILENNLFGLDIDDRAGQLAGFALMMLAREDDRRIFSRNIRLNVLSLQESINVNLPTLWRSLNLTGEWKSGESQGLFEEGKQKAGAFEADSRYQLLQGILQKFKQAKTFGSLIEIPYEDCAELKELLNTLRELECTGDSMQKAASSQLLPYVHQAVLLAQKYEAVVANPPYLAKKAMNTLVKEFVEENYSVGKHDLFSAFVQRAEKFLGDSSSLGFMTPFTWMFLSSYESLRQFLMNDLKLSTLVHPEYHSIWDSAAVPICAFTAQKISVVCKATFIDLSDVVGSDKQSFLLRSIEEHKRERVYEVDLSKFMSIPRSPFAYSLNDSIYNAYAKGDLLQKYASPKQGIKTGENDRFLRYWHEVDFTSIGRGSNDGAKSSARWFFCTKGGDYRKWYGNYEYVLNWENDGEEIKNFRDETGRQRSRPQNIDWFFKPGATWSTITSSFLSMRYFPEGFTFESKGSVCFPVGDWTPHTILSFMNNEVVGEIIKRISPTIDYSEGAVAILPVCDFDRDLAEKIGKECTRISREDWDSYEFSWGYKRNKLTLSEDGSLKQIYSQIRSADSEILSHMEHLENTLNHHFHQAYKMPESSSEKRVDQGLTLFSNKYYRYDCGDLSKDDELENRLRSDSISEVISYSIGCTFGRYSLDREGLIYAGSGNQGISELVAEGAYKLFPIDDDGIIPLTDQEWFPDDATNRFSDFVKVVWGEEHLHENLDFVAESLCLHAIKPKKSESSMDTIRRYLSTQFYKDHLKTYKKRPIYWLFSSGKQKAFECLVYLHRYNEGTLARMRTEYVIPLTAKMAAYAQKLENDKEASGSAAEVKRLEKEIAQLHKQQAELSEFDEKLRHYADQRISLNLDDGVKVNYGKFGDLLAEVKAITGEAPEALS